MNQYDVEIEVPDDDDLGPEFRTADNSWAPVWIKPLLAAMILAVLVLMVGAYLAGRGGSDRQDHDGSQASSSAPSTPDDPTVAGPDLEADSLSVKTTEAVHAWAQFARTGDSAELENHFDPNGPQFGELMASNEPTEVTFLPIDLSQTTRADGSTVVSLTMIVVDAEGETRYPYDFVYRAGSPLVWTVVDRRVDEDEASPPSGESIQSAIQSWDDMVEAIQADDHERVSSLVSPSTRDLANEILGAIGATSTPQSNLVDDQAVFRALVDSAESEGLDSPDSVVSFLVGGGRSSQLAQGTLAQWTEASNDVVVATLWVQDEPVATVPFTKSEGSWLFDFVAALELAQTP